MRGEWLYYPHGQKVGDEGIVDRRADEQHPKKTRERQMHNKEAPKTPSHLMRLVDLLLGSLLFAVAVAVVKATSLGKGLVVVWVVVLLPIPGHAPLCVCVCACACVGVE